MATSVLIIQNKLGLHARAAMKLIDTVSRFQSRATLIFNQQRADAKDILQTMCLGAKQGAKIELEVEGPDEAELIQAVQSLVHDKFGEME